MPAETFSFEDVVPPKKELTLEVADRSKPKAPVLSQQDYGQVSIPDGSLLPTDNQTRSIISEAAKKYGVPEPIMFAMAHQESTYNPSAVGPATKYGHARGMYQYIDDTAKRMGIDPMDARQSADAAAKQLSERLGKGIEWAVAAHHAGDNPKQHGRVTRQYTASIMAKAAAIAKELGDKTFTLPTPAPPSPEQPETFSFEDVMQNKSPGDVPVPGTQKIEGGGETKPAYTLEAFGQDLVRIGNPIENIRQAGNALKRGWEGLQEILNRDTKEVTLSEPELRAEWEAERKNDSKFLGAQTPDWETYKRINALSGNRRVVSATSYEDDELAWKKRLQDDPSQVDMLPARFKHLAPPQPGATHEGALASFMHTLKNPMELLTRDSLPANFVSFLANAPEMERKKYDEARKVAMQEEVVANPDKFPQVSVQSAQKAIDERRAKQDPGVREMWDNLKQAAKDDPGRFAGDLVNSLLADPELAFAPVGIGAKPIQAARAARGLSMAGRAARVVDQVFDAGTTAAMMNVAIGATQNLAQTGVVNQEEVKLNAAMGYLVGGPMGLLFMRGAKARGESLEAAKANGTYEQILKDQAAADVAMEDLIKGDFNDAYYRTLVTDQAAISRIPGGAAGRNVDQINKMLGITKSTDRAKLLEQRRKEIKQAFSNDPDYADYLKYVAEERMERAAVAREASARQAERLRKAADDARLSSQARREQLQSDFDAAIEARNNKEFSSLYDQAVNENKAFDSARKLNNEEMIDAIFTKDDPTIRQTEAKIRRREAQLRRPKWQRGEVDPTLLARVGLAGTAAGLAYTFSPEDYKLTNAVMVGLAGLMVPGPGRGGIRTSIPGKLRQAGMIDPEGNIIGMLVAKGRMANKLEAADLKARDNTWVSQAAKGDQTAYKNLYDTYFPETRRYVNKFMRELREKVGVDAEDVTQDAFLKAFQSLDSYSMDAPFGAWIKKIARNEALDAIDRMKTMKRGKDYTITGDEVPGVADAYSGDVGQGSTVYEKGAGADLYDTPEGAMLYEEASVQMQRAFEKLSPEMQDAIVKSQLENYTDVEIAELTDTPLGTVQRRIQRAKEMLADSIKSEFAGEPIRAPRNQRGEIDPALLKKAGIAAAGAALGWALSDDDPIWGMGVGAVAGLLLSGKVGASLVQGADYALGTVSTRVLNHSPKIHRAVVDLFRNTLQDTHGNFEKVDPFLTQLKKMPQDVQDVTHRALMTGDPTVIKKWLDHLGDKQLLDGYKEVRSVLDSLGDKQEALSRFKRKGTKEYFPRLVKDKEGLFAQAVKEGIFKDKEDLGRIQNAIKEAEIESMRKRGRGLNQAEESALINNLMFGEHKTNQPGYTKRRAIEEVSKDMQKFYASPEESLHTYIRAAVEDINRTKFFGKSAKNQVKGEQQFLDTDRSINNLIHDEVKSGALSDEGANEVAKLLKAVLVKGDEAPAWIVREAKNLASAGLLGNVWSAATQIGDVVMQVHLQDMRSTMDSIIRQVTGKKFVDMKDFGLVDSITAEFATNSKTARYVNKVFKYSLFAGVDKFGKNTALNAAISRAQRLADSPSGVEKLANKYAQAFGDDFPKLVSELKSGKVSNLTREYAFLELSRSQPITKFEMPQWWLESPNVGRSALILKSFMLKQIDLARRDGYNLMKQGKVAQGALALTQLGIVLGVAGTASDLIKQVLTSGVNELTGTKSKEIQLDAMDIPLNMLKTFGFSEYTKDRIFGVSQKEADRRKAAGEKGARVMKAEPDKAIPEMFIPPFRIWSDIVNKDPAMYRYLVPIFGPAVVEWAREADAEEKKERARQRKESRSGGTL